MIFSQAYLRKRYTIYELCHFAFSVFEIQFYSFPLSFLKKNNNENNYMFIIIFKKELIMKELKIILFFSPSAKYHKKLFSLFRRYIYFKNSFVMFRFFEGKNIRRKKRLFEN